MNWLDIVIIFLILLGAAGGYNKGLIASFSKLISYIVGVLGAYASYKSFAEFLKDLGVDNIIMEMTSSLINIPASISQVPIQNLSISKIQTTLDTMGMPAIYRAHVQELLQQLGTSATKSEVSTVGQALYYMISWAVLEFITFIALVFIIEIIVAFAIKLVIKMFSFTPAGFLDKWAGMIFGSAKSFAMVTITIVLITPLLTLSSVNKEGALSALSQGVMGSQIAGSVVELIK